MTKKKNSAPALKAPAAPPAPPAAVPPVENAPALRPLLAVDFDKAMDRIAALEARATELEGDLVRIARLCGDVWGEPLASQAMEIARKRQGQG